MACESSLKFLNLFLANFGLVPKDFSFLMEPFSATNNSPSAASPRSVDETVATTADLHEKHTETGAADGFLFAPEDLICSVLDLTRELEKLGVIEISPPTAFRLPHYRPDKFSRADGRPVKLWIGWARSVPGSTLWSTEEINALWVDRVLKGCRGITQTRRARKRTTAARRCSPSCATITGNSTGRAAGKRQHTGDTATDNMSFDSNPRDEVSAEEYYGEMEIAQLRELNAELLEFAEQFVKWCKCPREELDNLQELAEQAIAKAERLK
jgi:hypothetical protein